MLSSIKFGNKSIIISTTQWMNVINSVAIDANVKCAISDNSIICNSANAKALAMALEKKTKRLVFIKTLAQ